MALYYEVLISYDIEENKNRKKLFDELKDMGLVSIQKSVFWGHLKGAEITIISHLFDKYCSDNDKAFFVKANLAKEILKNSFGYEKQDFEVKEFEYI
ncbi:MAG: CRISPR-associated endonuclease Cas2 [Sulfurimonas sp.]|uniref:CRISPR-associated endonuclease Cas2 n=1 Tax=Sulfurimonas sp. TaxID=2022749 RepID=UPI0026193A9C|nr:CRISPR-associated endonuclease Cas2 [Sulfurimonas sp.]MDD2652863.1 CRISPR-associated endonuclease Cas2 [Sulfurimonas sp.]MDD3450908.1 CRISPR-associated endonuclease Cas2 [Sulfurimonas sp.]